MAYRLINDCIFLHVPKTGGTFIIALLKENGLVRERIGHEHADYERTNLYNWNVLTRKSLIPMIKRRMVPLGRKDEKPFRFCFVRHPLSWYESWWTYMELNSWRKWGDENDFKRWHPNAVLNGLGSPDFNVFVHNVARKRPGYVSELLFSYAKPNVDFVGKLENLRMDFSEICERLGLGISKETVFRKPSANVSRKKDLAPIWDPELRKLMMKLELPALLHFDYLSKSELANHGFDANPHIHPGLLPRRSS